jgi:SPX domain protein involved in polyphosphate accumulation
MVKFSKQLEASMVPEWKGAYVNYKGLKRLVNRIREERQVESHNLRRSSSVSSNWRNIGSSLSNLGDRLRRSTSTCANGALNDSVSDTLAVGMDSKFVSNFMPISCCHSF